MFLLFEQAVKIYFFQLNKDAEGSGFFFQKGESILLCSINEAGKTVQRAGPGEIPLNLKSTQHVNIISSSE